MQPDYLHYKAEDLLLDESFLHYCAGDPEAVKNWKAFISSHPEMEKEVFIAFNLYHNISVKSTAEHKSAALAELKTRIAQLNVNEEQTGAIVRPVNHSKIRRLLAVAAVTVGIIMAGTFLYLNKKNAFNSDTSPAFFAKASYGQEIHSAADQRKKITLPDGSEVTLNYGSSIRIASDYNEEQRWIHLDGEAFFEVKPDKNKPFVVITKNNATTALGTSFKVRNYAGESFSDVMLATGKVKVQSMSGKKEDKNVILLPGEKARSIQEGVLVKSTFDMMVLRDWQSLQIELNQANLDQIIASLEFNYGVQVKLQNKPARPIAFTGKFSKESLHDVLEAMSYTNKFSYTQRGTVVSILFQ